jgi:hypothetical protein
MANYNDNVVEQHGRATANDGCIHISSADGAKTGLNIYAFIPDQDTVIGTMTGFADNDSVEDFKTTMALTGKTLKAGTYFAVPLGARITAITVTSGAIIAYKRS